MTGPLWLLPLTMVTFAIACLETAALTENNDEPPGGLAVVDVQLAPSSLQLAPGQSQQFQAHGVDPSGNLISASFTWSATGGTITQQGLYTAGDVAGQYAVEAREESGLSDTAAVVITNSPPPPPPPPPGGPYPPSPVLAGMTFDFSTHDRRAPGSDNWPITWADNDHQYASWGDGGGFGGTNQDGRESLGVARIEGPATSYTGYNVYGGKNAENPAPVGGKSYGIISVNGVMYMWVSPGSGTRGYEEARLYQSNDHAATWTGANWSFVQSDGLIFPTFLQFGKDYAGARDSYVYVYANHLKAVGDRLEVQKPGEIALLRVPANAIMDRSQYEFFAGLDGADNPIWVSDIRQREPVFEDANGVGWNTSASYNAGVGRYLIVTEHEASRDGNIGVFDAPEPWGPWTTVHYDTGFGVPNILPSVFFWNFSNKWLSADGTDFVLIFTGTGENDSWNTVHGRLLKR